MLRTQLFGHRRLRKLDCQPVKLFERKLDFVVRVCTLRKIQFHRGTTQAAIGAPHHRNHHVQITRQLHHRRRCRTLLALPLRLQEQLRLGQQALPYGRRGTAPGRIQLARFATAQAMPRNTLRHAATVFRVQARHRHQELHRHMRCDRAIANLLLDSVGKQLHQPHPARYPTCAAIETPSQLLQPIAEALLQFNQKPALFKSRFVIAHPHRPVQKKSIHFAQ